MRTGEPPLQVIKRELIFEIAEEDLCGLDEVEREKRIAANIKADRTTLFNARDHDAPLFRFKILIQSQRSMIFLMSIHHALTDGWGNVEFLKELFQLYQAIKGGAAPPVTQTVNSYKEFIALEQEILASGEAENFWNAHLLKASHKPLRKITPPPGASTVENRLRSSMEETLAADLHSLSRKMKVSLKAVFLSAYCDLVASIGDSEVVTVGVVSNGRSERLSDPLKALGLFWNIVPFCCEPDRTDKLAQLKDVQRLLIEIESFARYPLPQILANQKRSELFFATLNFLHFHNAGQLALDSAGVRLLDADSHDKFHFPLNYIVSVNPFNSRISLDVEFDRLYFSIESVKAYGENYLEFLRSYAGATR